MVNDHLRRRREATLSPSGSGTPMTRAELARAVNEYVWRTTGRQSGLDVDTLARYERGLIRWPNADYRAGLRAVLGVARDAELGFHKTRRGRSAEGGPDTATWVRSWADEDHTSGTSADVPDTAIDLLRQALLTYAPATGTDSTRADLTSAKSEVATAFDAYQAGNFEAAALASSSALRALRAMERRGGSTDARVLALANQVGAIVLSKAGSADVAWIAADRGVSAAEASGDPTLQMSLLRTAAYSMASAGRRPEALTLVDRATSEFQRRMSQTAASAAVYGTMLLTGAVLLAADQNSAKAAAYLDEAHEAALVVGVDRNDLWTAFGPTNVAIHRANIAAVLGDMDTVLAVGAPLDVEHAPIERQVRLHLDVARAHFAAGNHDSALATLLQAEAVAPSQVRHHYITRQVVSSLVETMSRRPGVDLARLARLADVPLA
ncbi:hypothetical protein [Promicromonospora sp. NPDC090134]|uniref:hypothetical protein n=1 Tax=Promicromonospora sp. NPDC090134 TaxID=3364408 RepID=UPI003809BA65